MNISEHKLINYFLIFNISFLQRELTQIFFQQQKNIRIGHRNYNVIVSGSQDKQIKIWNAKDGSYTMEYQNAHDDCVLHVLFKQDDDLLVSIGYKNLIIWAIHYEQKKIQQLKIIDQKCHNIQLDINQQIDHNISYHTILQFNQLYPSEVQIDEFAFD
ncbi:hypothetical protein pb186bvf_014169 [Paramecium bursaria]